MAGSLTVTAIVTSRRDGILYGGAAPVFYGKDHDEVERIALWLSRITNMDVHDLHDGTMFLSLPKGSH